MTCHICGSSHLREHGRYAQLRRITSDCKPWRDGGALRTCLDCGSTHVPCSKQWREDIRHIYESYTIYYQGGGEEQKVFDATTGEILPRSEWLLGRIVEHRRMPDTGRALDIGCGNGRFLKALGARFSSWTLFGTEFDGKYKELVEALPCVEEMIVGGLDAAVGTFDFVSLIHVLEHIEQPQDFLKEVKEKVGRDGYLFIELPSYQGNPFELLIADHATHFTIPTAARLLVQAGFEVSEARSDWVAKELSLLAGPSCSAKPKFEKTGNGDDVELAISWLLETSREMCEVAGRSQRFGIFGTSIAGTWLTAELGRVPDFYVDEDPNRIGTVHNGAPILSPAQVSPESDVFVGQPHGVATRIASRLSGGPGTYHIPSTSIPST